MFIVKKKISGKEYYYLRKSQRQGDKVVAKTIAYLGKTMKEAEAKKKEIEASGVKGKKNINRVEVSERNMSEETKISVEELATFCKRKGFVYPSGEIYGGMAGFWDYGPLGTEFVNNLKREWWKYHVYKRQDIVGIDGSIITNPKVWKASGHVDSFVDVAVYNKKTKEKTKVDKHELAKLLEDKNWESKGEFNPMFTTAVGPVKDDSVEAYLRPETAQLIFADFKSVWENARMKLPGGIAQIGKAFRNEISPREFLFRSREFEQMEIEYFISPDQPCEWIKEIEGVKIKVLSEDMQKSGGEGEEMLLTEALEKGIVKRDWHAYWMGQEYRWFTGLGAKGEKFRVRQHMTEERSHYSSDTWDLEYEFPFGWRELQGFADRGDYDLSQHEKHSGKKLSIVDGDKKVLPEVVCEPSLGVGRAFIVFMLSAYEHDKERDNTVLHLDPKLAPVKAAVFPIVKSEEYETLAKQIVADLSEEWNVIYDKSGSIGRRYARNDESGTPYCITVDEESGKSEDCTIRDRDSKKQVRVPVKGLKDVVRRLIASDLEFEKAGKLVE
tara:strand:+ start:490 stop:2151 length:1662 start_codon:yes stop_codon:yes gene_type:complete